MKRLTQAAFQKAKTFVLDQGSALDQRRFEYHFEAGSADAVLAALASYQNDDGGVGHSLEPDIRTPASSAIATTIAFQILREIRASAGLEKEIEMNLDFEVAQQGEDGSWYPNFSWGDQYPETWPTVRREWQARFTVDNLKALRDFGRIK